MVEWPFGIGDTRQYTVVSGGARVPERGERVYFVPLDSARIGATDVTRRPLGEVLDESARLRLRHTLETKQAYVAEAIATGADGRWQARVSWPVEVIPLTGPIQIVLSVPSRRQVESRWQEQLHLPRDVPAPELDEASLLTWLQQVFVYQANFLVFNRVEDKPDELVLLGPAGQLRCHIRKRSFLWAANAGRLPKEHEPAFERAGVIEARAEWHFSQARLPEVAEGALNVLQAIAAKSEYFAIWDEYGKLEQEMLANRMAALGPLHFRRLKYFDDVVRFYLEPGANTAAWRDQALGLSAELVTRPKRRARTSQAEEAVHGLTLGAIRRVKPDFVDVDRTDDEPGLPDRGELRVSPIGDTVRLARQRAARDQLQLGLVPLRHLQTLLAEGKTDEITNYPVPAFTSQPQRQADGTTPNERQVQAIAMALNTPDLAVIQGPPGTGKTAVIRTILRRLKEQGRRHLLVSSHQHTAVDNVLKGTAASGVVAYRFGGNEDSESYRNEELDSWVVQVTGAVNAELERLPVDDGRFEQRLRLKSLVEQAALTHLSLPACQELLARASEDYAEVLPIVLGQRAETLRAALESEIAASQPASKPGQGNQLKEARRALAELPADAGQLSNTTPLAELGAKLQALRTEGIGDVAAFQEYRRSQNKVSALLPRVQLTSQPAQARAQLQSALDAVRQAAQQFIEACLEVPVEAPAAVDHAYGEDYWRSKFHEWCRQVAQAVGREAEASSSQVVLILNRWRETINTRPAQVQQLLSKHADVWGVTCQQSAAKRFGLYDSEFDCVVVDEAARTSPLDLLIPLVRARRIILVGDHRQLPHALDYQLEKEFETAIRQPEHRELLKASLFARLYDQLPTSKRVRLNVQYRMHPVIGRMVSQAFYADDPLEDAPATADLVNDTGLFDGHSLVWLDTSSAPGQRESGQYHNSFEAEWVLECVRRLLGGPRADSVGIITYYAQQRDQIDRLLRDHVPGSQRVQVGSVDAFQGEQKEVVLLSTVRSNPDRRIGFLSSPNRINVSVSRARRLLVIIGDAATVSASPHLKSVLDYCQQVNSVLHALPPA
ncbi:MAG: AAA family ATPase [Anaerolineales bacterium]|nr:AAA family ATPase [Anaerolineales bacterium]